MYSWLLLFVSFANIRNNLVSLQLTGRSFSAIWLLAKFKPHRLNLLENVLRQYFEVFKFQRDFSFVMRPKGHNDIKMCHYVFLQIIQFFIFEERNLDIFPNTGFVIEVKIAISTLYYLRCPWVIMPPTKVNAIHIAIMHEVIITLRWTPYQVVIPFVQFFHNSFFCVVCAKFALTTRLILQYLPCYPGAGFGIGKGMVVIGEVITTEFRNSM